MHKFDKLCEIYTAHTAMVTADQYAMNDEKYLRSKANELANIADRIKSGAADFSDVEKLRDMSDELEEQADMLYRKSRMATAG